MFYIVNRKCSAIPKQTIASNIKSLNIKKTSMTMEFQVLAWDRHTNVVRLNWLMRFSPLFLIGYPTQI